MYPLVEDMSEIYARPLPRVYAIFCLPLSSQPRLNLLSTQQQGRARRAGGHTGGARPCCCVLRLSPGWRLNGKEKNSTYSSQRTGIYFDIFQPYFFEKISNPPPLPCSSWMLRYAEICWVAWAAWALADYSMANRKIAYTLGRGRAYIFDMSSTSGYMGEKYF